MRVGHGSTQPLNMKRCCVRIGFRRQIVPNHYADCRCDLALREKSGRHLTILISHQIIDIHVHICNLFVSTKGLKQFDTKLFTPTYRDYSVIDRKVISAQTISA